MELATLRRDDRTDQPSPPTPPTSSAVAAAGVTPLTVLAGRWLRLHRDEIRALAVGAVSIALFLLAWHLLTTYRVNLDRKSVV